MQPDPLTIGLILLAGAFLCAALYYRGQAGAARVERDDWLKSFNRANESVLATASKLRTCEAANEDNARKLGDWMHRHSELSESHGAVTKEKNRLTDELVAANEAGTKEAARISELENRIGNLNDKRECDERDLARMRAENDTLDKAHAATLAEKHAALENLAEKNETLREVAGIRDRYKRSAEEQKVRADRLAEDVREVQTTVEQQIDVITARNKRIDELESERNEYQQADSAKRTEIAKLKGHAGTLESKLAALTTTRPTKKKPARRTAKKKTKR